MDVLHSLLDDGFIIPGDQLALRLLFLRGLAGQLMEQLAALVAWDAEREAPDTVSLQQHLIQAPTQAVDNLPDLHMIGRTVHQLHAAVVGLVGPPLLLQPLDFFDVGFLFGDGGH